MGDRGFESRRGRQAEVAQLVEHATENRSVGGSIPPLGTRVNVSRPPNEGGFMFTPTPDSHLFAKLPLKGVGT